MAGGARVPSCLLFRKSEFGQVAERSKAADCKSAGPCGLRRFESSPVHREDSGEWGAANRWLCGKARHSASRQVITVVGGGSNSVVESQPSKLLVAGSIPVSRSSSKSKLETGRRSDIVGSTSFEFRFSSFEKEADVAQLVEHVLGKDGVSGSIPLIGSRTLGGTSVIGSSVLSQGRQGSGQLVTNSTETVSCALKAGFAEGGDKIDMQPDGATTKISSEFTLCPVRFGACPRESARSLAG